MGRIVAQLQEELNIKEIELLDASDPFYAEAVEASGRKKRAAKLGDFQAVLDGGYMVAIDTVVTPDLAQEGHGAGAGAPDSEHAPRRRV